jgi:hypothetical protein
LVGFRHELAYFAIGLSLERFADAPRFVIERRETATEDRVQPEAAVGHAACDKVELTVTLNAQRPTPPPRTGSFRSFGFHAQRYRALPSQVASPKK